ncbi:amidase [Aspergillus brunneoviolaceus CBS 621.78]|uniref:N-acylethanolamine amidohydrolase n=1 Tax=Aspergillus brunneoviolaceus CBS 621.78 TaxID=1450534 RepID=A0ACD1GLU3_9EURO|nr:N-acylethanolamine amidohydrolase [Aspergillus brunneoviolaceus CBS 621.78]RAH50244.1 N-acylethanolamine amidohydrolase [Aspergillus brunneoviolaceus CBS 621.78]
MSAKPQFFQYPEVREGPSVPYKNEDQVIPVFRGMPLAIGASLIQHVGFIQDYFWRNAGFNVIRVLPLDDYAPRYDPTVIPFLDCATSSSSSASTTTTTTTVPLPVPTQRRKDHTGYYTSADYVALYQSGQLTPSAVVEALLPLIRRDVDSAEEQKGGRKHSVAFLESQAERVRAAAAASTQRYKAGQPLGPMDGVPVAVKDEVHLEGYQRTLGSKIDFKGKYQGTSWCAKQWEDAGAIIIGKTTMHELGLDTNNNNPNYGTPRNPHNHDYYCGGSSGGSGYAVSAGLVPIALGADGGGSIRIPSSFCGIWGLKPTHGRISGTPTVSLAPTVGVYGPMASSLDDLALAYRIMATPAPAAQDPISAAFPPPLSTLPPSSSPSTIQESQPPRRTIGLIPAWLERAHPTVRTCFDQAVTHLTTTADHEARELGIPYLPEGQRAHVLTIMAEIASGLQAAQISHLSAPNKVLVSMGMYQITGQDFLAAQRLRHCLMAHLAHLFQQHPGLIICTPTTPIPGWKIQGPEDLTRGLSDGGTSVRNMEYVWLANFTGCPAISCPVGWVDADGGDGGDGGKVPVGLMAMAEWGKEEELITFARELEGVLGAAEGGGGGIRVPGGEGALWEDIIELAKRASTA